MFKVQQLYTHLGGGGGLEGIVYFWDLAAEDFAADRAESAASKSQNIMPS